VTRASVTELESLQTTDSGHVPKRVAMSWFEELAEPTSEELRRSIVSKPHDFSGSTYATEISTVRYTGSPEFVETVTGFLEPLSTFEDRSTRLELNLGRTEDRQTGELTNNYAFYLSVAERPYVVHGRSSAVRRG
jgi:hypothetical protein